MKRTHLHTRGSLGPRPLCFSKGTGPGSRMAADLEAVDCSRCLRALALELRLRAVQMARRATLVVERQIVGEPP